MQQENLLVNNKVCVIGKIISEFVFSHEVYGEGFYNFSLEVPRLSQITDILPVTISERLIDKRNFPIGTDVSIIGQIRSYNNFLETDKRNKLVLTLFTREIEILEEASNKNPNEIYLNGYVCKLPVYRATPFGREITDILLAVNRSYNKSDYIPCIAWGRNARFAGKLNVGDNIEVFGRMQSRQYQKKYEDGKVEEKTAYEISISKIEIAKNSSEEKSETTEQENNQDDYCSTT